MMMQMLEAGGMQILTDNTRSADEDNTRGYHEFEKAKHLKDDSSWIEEAEGKAVKIVSMLLYDLPTDHEYKAVFMTRDMGEVLASQRDMLKRRGEDVGPDDDAMRTHFEKHLARMREWLTNARHIRTLYCDYNVLLADPSPVADAILEFLNMESRPSPMVAIIDKTLHKHTL